MTRKVALALLAAGLAFLPAPGAYAEGKKTVCTITVNSADERETFRRNLPADDYRFVELVERGRSDWLASACRQGVRCDVLVISGHFDGGTEFYTDSLDAREYLPVDEMERVSCSDSCPGLFSRLKEVYLFGCNTLNAEPLRSASDEIGRSLVRAGHSPADAERLSRVLSERHAESNRDRMRNVFKDVPVIYGFSGKAPLGRYAGPVLDRYLRTGGVAEIGSGRASATLLGAFAPTGMTVATGATDADAHAGFRRDACQFSDDRLTVAGKVGFVHELLRRDMAEVRMFLDAIERFAGTVGGPERRSPATAQALEGIARDRDARDRFLAFARDADEPAVRMRMTTLARAFDWLSADEERDEYTRMVLDRSARNATDATDVRLACTLDRQRDLGRDLVARPLPSGPSGGLAHAAVLACLGSPEGHARVLGALVGGNHDDVQIAQIYLHHRPIADTGELRAVTSGIVRMPGSEAQVRALDTLAGHRLDDPESLTALAHLFPKTRSLQVQRAIAGILIRADFRTLSRIDVVKTLVRHRLRSPDGRDLIDVLIRRLQSV
ncbi:hypothetical protein BURK1_03302 [Burkholderiales bacterium]|nr:hypothetical protein BURK1_03302 [Burkholderiales bacterium]